MFDNARARGGDLVSRALRSGFAPNRPVGAVCFAGFLGEVGLLASGRGGLGHGPGVAAWTVIALAWLWLTTGWTIHLASRLVRGPRVVRGATFALLSVTGVALALLLGASWSIFLGIGSFATFDMLGLIAPCVAGADQKMAALMLAEAKRAVAGIALALVGVPAVLAAVVRAPAVATPAVAARTWLHATLGMAAASMALVAAPGPIDARWEVVRRGVSPTLTFVFTGLERLDSSQVKACLDPTELTERRPFAMPAPRERRSVLLIKVESMRADMLLAEVGGVPVMPNLKKLASEGTHFTRAYAPATHTDYSDTAVHTSHHAALGLRHTDYGANPRWPRVTISSVLRDAGYRTGFFSSGDCSWIDMDVVLREGIEEFHDSRSLPEAGDIVRAFHLPDDTHESIDDATTTSATIRWLEARSAGEPFVATIDLQSGHFPYAVPARAPQPFAPAATSFAEDSFVHYPVAKTPLALNAYRNALRYADEQIGRLVAALEGMGRLDDTVIAVWADHGEMFHDVEGYVTHSREPFEGAARVPLVVRAPGLVPVGQDDEPVQTIDLVPTVCGRLGLPVHPSFQGVDLFSAQRPSRDERLVFTTCDMVVRADAVVMGGRWKLIKDRSSGRELFFDLASDPRETTSLAETETEELRSARSTLREWRERQIAYYRFPTYYERYWPPRVRPLQRLALGGR